MLPWVIVTLIVGGCDEIFITTLWLPPWQRGNSKTSPTTFLDTPMFQGWRGRCHKALWISLSRSFNMLFHQALFLTFYQLLWPQKQMFMLKYWLHVLTSVNFSFQLLIFVSASCICAKVLLIEASDITLQLPPLHTWVQVVEKELSPWSKSVNVHIKTLLCW